RSIDTEAPPRPNAQTYRFGSINIELPRRNAPLLDDIMFRHEEPQSIIEIEDFRNEPELYQPRRSMLVDRLPSNSRYSNLREQTTGLKEPAMPWTETPANIADLEHHKLRTIARVWEKLGEEQRALPGADLYKQAEIIDTLHLGSDKAQQLGQNPEF